MPPPPPPLPPPPPPLQLPPPPAHSHPPPPFHYFYSPFHLPFYSPYSPFDCSNGTKNQATHNRNSHFSVTSTCKKYLIDQALSAVESLKQIAENGAPPTAEFVFEKVFKNSLDTVICCGMFSDPESGEFWATFTTGRM